MTTDYPAAIDFPAHPDNILSGVNHPKGWVLHTPEEDADDNPATPYWFANPGAEASTHYFVSYLGFVYQCVPEARVPIANGVNGKPYPPWANNQITLNAQTLSVEIEGRSATIAQTISPAQRTALLNLLDYGCEKYSIAKDRVHIIGHYQVASNRSDPGTLDIDALVADMQPKPRPVVKEDIDMFLARAVNVTPQAAYIIGPEGKRPITSNVELEVYQRKLGKEFVDYNQEELNFVRDM